MLRKIKNILRPFTLSSGVEVVCGLYHRKSSTPRWYRSVFALAIAEWGDVPVRDVTPEMVHQFHDDLLASGRSPWTIDSYMRCLRSFFNKMVTLGHLEESPAGKVRLPRLPKKTPKGMPWADVQAMVSHARYYPRDHALVRMLAATGCRVGELVSMRTAPAFLSLTPPVGLAVVVGKGHKIRPVRFGEETIQAVCVYLECRPAGDEDSLWLSHQGTPLTGQGVYHLLRKVAKRAGVPKFNPHAFRHAFAQRLHDNGAPPRFIQEMLGHEDITTTLAMYVDYDDEAVSRMYHQLGVDDFTLR